MKIDTCFVKRALDYQICHFGLVHNDSGDIIAVAYERFRFVCGLTLLLCHEHLPDGNCVAPVLGVRDGRITIAGVILEREDAVDCLDGPGAFKLDDLGFPHGGISIGTFVNGTVAREKSQYVQIEIRTD